MGGNALKESKTEVIRANKEELYKTKEIVEYELKKFFPNLKVNMPRFIKEKKDFGDLDLVLTLTDNNRYDYNYNKLKEFLNKTFNNPTIVKNNNVLSFGFPLNNKTFQVDLIFVPNQYYETSLRYLSDNDLSNLIGRLARQLNLKYSHKGLSARIKLDKEFLNNKKIDDIFLTNDIETIFKVLDLNFNKYKKGFDTFDEMFDLIIESKYFNPKIFLFTNHEDRKKDGKRKVYMQFLEKIKQLNPENYNLIKDKEKLYIDILKQFGKYEIYQKKLSKIKNNKIISKYFNGNVIKKNFGLSGKELGNFIKTIKNNKIFYQNLSNKILEYVKNKKTDKFIENYIIKEIKRDYKKYISIKEIL